MKKIIKKCVALTLGLMLLATGTLTTSAYARTTSTSKQLGFQIYGISDANRIYSSGKVDSAYTYSTTRSASDGRSVSINTLECLVYFKCSIGASSTYVSIDGKYSDQDDYGYFEQSGNTYFEGIKIKYLSPGKHKVQIKIDQFDPNKVFTTVQSSQTLEITVPAYEDTYIKRSLAKINNGTATIDDYEIVAVDPTKISSPHANIKISELNEKVKGKDLTISNVQSTVYKFIDEINALSLINKGTETISDYTTLGISGVTSTNLSTIKSAIKSAKTVKGSNLSLEDIQEVVNAQITPVTTASVALTTTSAAVTVG